MRSPRIILGIQLRAVRRNEPLAPRQCPQRRREGEREVPQLPMLSLRSTDRHPKAGRYGLPVLLAVRTRNRSERRGADVIETRTDARLQSKIAARKAPSAGARVREFPRQCASGSGQIVSCHGARNGRFNKAFASSSPTTCSFSPSHVIFRPSRQAMLSRCPGFVA